jgi:hypothetical protein
MGWFTPKYGPGLADGLTMAQWNELYGEPRWRRVRRKLKQGTLICGVLLLIGIVGMTRVYGPPERVSRSTRGAVSLFALYALGGFLICGGMLVGEFLMRRYGDTYVEKAAEPRRGKYRHKKS